jgi:hypothetical protein
MQRLSGSRRSRSSANAGHASTCFCRGTTPRRVNVMLPDQLRRRSQPNAQRNSRGSPADAGVCRRQRDPWGRTSRARRGRGHARCIDRRETRSRQAVRDRRARVAPNLRSPIKAVPDPSVRRRARGARHQRQGSQRPRLGVWSATARMPTRSKFAEAWRGCSIATRDQSHRCIAFRRKREALTADCGRTVPLCRHGCGVARTKATGVKHRASRWRVVSLRPVSKASASFTRCLLRTAACANQLIKNRGLSTWRRCCCTGAATLHGGSGFVPNSSSPAFQAALAAAGGTTTTHLY